MPPATRPTSAADRPEQPGAAPQDGDRAGQHAAQMFVAVLACACLCYFPTTYNALGQQVHWVAITATLVIEPTWGAVLSKSLYRILGTIVGGEGCHFLVFVQLSEKHGTFIERNTALIERVSPCRILRAECSGRSALRPVGARPV
eukprot:SAG31_NODE_3821_length_3852_cov_4.553424_5_plen_145_part_00